MLLIYCPKITNRVRFIFKLYFKEILGLEQFEITSNLSDFRGYEGAKASYATVPVSDELFFLAKGLLSETGIRDHTITVFEWQGVKCFFSTSRNSALPFDPYAAAFYLVSRYEEYLPNIHDKYGRYEAKESLAFQNDFLQQPVVNIWAEKIKDVVQKRFPDLAFSPRAYSFVPTLDIDNAFAYREKGILRTLGAYIRSLFRLKFSLIAERTRVLLGLQQDPYDTYDYQKLLHEKYNLKPIYFFLVADYGVNDKNVPVQSRVFRSLIKSIADTADVGIHPSYASNTHPEKLEMEITRLSKILNREVTKSRQHFLRLTLPDTFRSLIDLDIMEDYTIGYASEIGFRAGICTPFYFYDIDLEIETRLRLNPFAVMDGTLKFYLKIKPEEAMSKIIPLIESVKQVKGTFISLWHNDSLSNAGEWAGWRDVYEKMVDAAATD